MGQVWSGAGSLQAGFRAGGEIWRARGGPFQGPVAPTAAACGCDAAPRTLPDVGQGAAPSAAHGNAAAATPNAAVRGQNAPAGGAASGGCGAFRSTNAAAGA